MKAKIMPFRQKIESTVKYILKNNEATFLASNCSTASFNQKNFQRVCGAFNAIEQAVNLNRENKYKNVFAHIVIAYAPGEVPPHEEMEKHLKHILEQAGIDVKTTPFFAVVHNKAIKGKDSKVEQEGQHIHLIFPTFNTKKEPWLKPSRFTDKKERAYQNKQWATHDSAIMFQQISAETELKFNLVQTEQASYIAQKVAGVKVSPNVGQSSKRAKDTARAHLAKRGKMLAHDEAEAIKLAVAQKAQSVEDAIEIIEQHNAKAEKVERRGKLTAIKIIVNDAPNHPVHFALKDMSKHIELY